ncbi:MAG: DUF1330 domain-containing protein [Blastomonas sp.]
MSENYVDPSPEGFQAFKDLPRDRPIAMLNMIRYHEKAQYPSDHPYAAEALTGEEAYRRYGRESGPVFLRVGGSLAWGGDFQAMVIGPFSEHWDRIFVARYPSGAAFLEMVTDPDYRKAVVNRNAAVADSRLIRIDPHESQGGTFA